ncbi:hypothetical protein Tco_0494837 [Tanacetum coccineum]
MLLIFTPELGLGTPPKTRLTRLSHTLQEPEGIQLQKFEGLIQGVKIYFNKLAPSVGPFIQSTGALKWRVGGSLKGALRDDIGATPAGISGSIVGSTTSGVHEDIIGTQLARATPSVREQIEGHLSALRSLVKEHNSQCNVSSIYLSFDVGDGRTKVRTVVTGKEVVDADLKRPFKKAVKTPLTRRIIEFAGPEFKMPSNIKLYDRTTDPEDHLSRFLSATNSCKWLMPVWCRMLQQTLDESARGWFENLSGGSIDGWVELKQQFTTRFLTRKACFKDPTEITKIVRKGNETIVAFKERWIVEIGFIVGVPEVIKISSFMDAHKCPELAKRSEEAFSITELPKGEASEASKRSIRPISKREDRFNMGGYGVDRRRNEGMNTFNNRDGLVAYRLQASYQAPRADHQGYHNPRVNLNSLTKQPKEILASELQLNLQPPRPMQLPPKKENQDRYCDYHREKWHYTNDYFQLRRQLEMALESGKLNHLIKDVRQRGRGNTKGRDAGKDKVINMIRLWPDDRKRKSKQRGESWMKAPIVLSPLSMEDASDEPLIIEAIMEGYLVRRVYVDRGASVEVMFEHRFENLSLAMRSLQKSTQMDLVRLAGGVVKPLGKIELEDRFKNPLSSFFDNILHGKVSHSKMDCRNSETQSEHDHIQMSKAREKERKAMQMIEAETSQRKALPTEGRNHKR